MTEPTQSGIRSHFLRQRFLQGLMAAVALLCLMPAPGVLAQGPPINAEKAAKEGTIWGGLIFATDVPPLERRPPPGEFPDLPRRLARVFPYKHYEVLGEHNQVIFR